MNTTTIGGRIKYHRKRLGLTQEQLAERMGVSAQAVSKWENDLSCPDISILPQLADVFGITVDELLGKQTDAPVHDAEVVGEKNREDDCSHGFELNLSGFKYKRYGGILFALYILSVGALLLVNNLCALDVSWWTIVWTTAVVYIGLGGLCSGFSLLSVCLSLGGLYFLLSAFNIIRLSVGWGVVLPACLLLWGVSLLIDVFFGKHRRFRKGRKGEKWGVKSVKTHEFRIDDGFVHCDLSFGERREAVAVELLRGGNIDTCFGEFRIDFSACAAVAPDCCIHVDNSFGSLTLLIPDKFAVQTDSDESFGAVQIKGAPSLAPQGTIRLDADISFGSLIIQYI